MSKKAPKDTSKVIEKKVLEVIQVKWEQNERVREILSILRENIQQHLGSFYVAKSLKV